MSALRSVSAHFHPLLVQVVFILLTGCQFTPARPLAAASSPTPAQTSSLAVQPTSSPAVNTGQPAPTLAASGTDSGIETATQTPQPASPPEFTPAKIHLSAKYDHASHSLAVTQQIDYTNNTGVDLFDLVLLVEPNRYAGVFQLERLDWQASGAVTDYVLQNNRLTISLPKPISPGALVSLDLGYTLRLPTIPEDSEEYKPVPFGYTQRQVNLIDWYPFLPPYRPGVGWLAHDPGFFGEHQVYDLADYDVEIELTGSAEPLVLAASTQPESQDSAVYRYRLQAARTFVLSLSPYYQVYTRQVGDTTVLSYGLPYFEEGAQAALQYTAEALGVYNELFGMYPRQSLSVVVADFLDGMEYDGLYFLSRGFFNIYDGTPAGYLTIIAVHETAHQWWYGQVGNDQAFEPWLDEALCTYSELLYYERLHPELVDWWWNYRVNFYQPVGPVNASIYAYNGFRPYRDAVYLRGAQFLEALRQRVGDEAFLTFLKAYTDRFKGKIASADDFFLVLEENSSADLADLRQQFFNP